jgi:hypothetical protein
MNRPAGVVQAVLLVIISTILLALGPSSVSWPPTRTVTDPQGAVMPGATVTLMNKNTNAKLTSTSDDNGIYQFNALRPAPDRLTG